MPPVAKDIPHLPPENFPAFDPAKPDTDFQLQQALVLVHGMASMKRAAAN
jgi:carboxyl-terminal processing protease